MATALLPFSFEQWSLLVGERAYRKVDCARVRRHQGQRRGYWDESPVFPLLESWKVLARNPDWRIASQISLLVMPSGL